MKIDKYDRQVRIWGTKGQKKLTFAKIAVLGCSGASIEAAKNLILPGIGRIDILDDKIITV
jgi:amyloid beta precursor protein binding protein 1